MHLHKTLIRKNIWSLEEIGGDLCSAARQHSLNKNIYIYILMQELPLERAAPRENPPGKIRSVAEKFTTRFWKEKKPTFDVLDTI